MRVTLRQKNLRITTSLETYIEKKIVIPVRRLLKGGESSDLPMLDLEFSRTTKHHKKGLVYYAEATITFGKKSIRAEVTAEDMRVACDMLKDELERELTALKGRREALRRRDARRVKRELRFSPGARTNRRGRVRDEGR